MSQVLTFRHPRQELIDQLEDYLERVKKGDITSFIMLYNGPDAFGTYTGSMSLEEMRHYVFLLEDLKQKVLKLYHDHNRKN